jgi:amino acid transporter
VVGTADTLDHFGGQAFVLEALKRFLIGEPKATAQAPHERLSNPIALAVLSSDALSSVAYATEEILLVLVLAGAAALAWTSAIAGAIALLYVIVTASYRQTIQAYPTGGGAYSVSKDNLGIRAGLLAGSALLIDYVLTVAVSVAAGVAAITSAFPDLYAHRVIVGVVTVAAIAMVNLRGVRESGRLFAVPTYLFIASFLSLIVVGMARVLYGEAPMAPPHAPPAVVPTAAVAAISPFLILRAFSSGCVALTGVEAISNGVLAFRKPEAENAKQTMAWMATIMLTFFIGITFLARQYEILPREGETVVSQLARTIVGTGLFYYVIQAATALVLLLAANTSFAGFPRLSSLLAADRFLPRQFVNRGDRLVFSNGIIILALLASLLLVLFGGDTHALIPLYAVGVFISFTLSQAGMVRHHLQLREPGWRRGALINGTGALATGIVLTVIAGTKFIHGAWMVVITIPILVGMFAAIHRHYRQVGEQLRIKHFAIPDKVTHAVLLLVSDVHMGVLNALNYSRAISPDVEAVYVNVDEEATKQMRLRWALWSGGVPLVVLDSPYRSVVQPLIEYVDKIQAERKVDFVTIVLPEFVPARWWHTLLHNQTAFWIRANFLFRKGTVVINVRFHLDT